MVKETLEIRGIHRKKLITYIQEIKHTFARRKITGYWDYVLSEEEYFFMFQSEIPKVYITFKATTPELLTKILKEFRLKTWRAGA